jgi:hypothetical protein
MSFELEQNYCCECGTLETSLQTTATELRQVEDSFFGTADYFRQTARLLIKRNRILEQLAQHQRLQHLRAS